MPIIGTYGTGSTFSNRYSTVDELLIQLPDNSANLITAEDVRDSVYSLWARIDDVQTIAASAASQSSGTLYNSTGQTIIAVGGVTAGSTFVNQTIQNVFDRLFFPHIGPTASIQISNTNPRDFGSSLAVSFNWQAYRNSSPILNPSGGIFVNGNPEPSTPPGNSQTGTSNINGTHSTTVTNPQEIQTFTISVTDGIVTNVATASLIWKTRIYWGRIDYSSIGNPNLTLNPGSFSLCQSLTTDVVIQSLDGAGANGLMVGTELSNTKNKTYLGMSASGQYLIFAWPSIVSGANNPKFTVNGVESTAFTRIRTSYDISVGGGAFSNSVYASGYSGINYEVWVSNTVQNSPLDITIS